MSPSKTMTGRMAAAFIDSKLTILVMLAALAFGLWSVMTTPREENPQITMPAAGVRVFLPGADPDEVEAKVARPLEALINQIEGVDHVWSVSEDSQVTVTVQFKVGEDKEASLVKLADRIMSGRNQLPQEVVGPFIASADVDDVPVLALTFFSKTYDDEALHRVAESVADRLMGLKDISTLSVIGGRARELTVDVDPARLESFHLSMDAVKAAIAAANLAGPLGMVTDADTVTRVRLADFIAGAEDLKHLVVGVSPTGGAVHLSDVATISDGGTVTRTTASRFAYGQADTHYDAADKAEYQAVTLAVAKRKGSNAVVLCNTALERLERMKGSVIPEGIGLEVTRNDGVKADSAVNTLIEHLGIALVAVVSVTFFFLGWRPAVIVAVTVPLILSITLGVVGIAGFTINRLTLYALIIALGLLVDDSIVVIENIVRHYGLSPIRNRDDRLMRSIEAPGEIGSATLLATVAVMLVFASLIPALSGMAKQYFYPVGFSVPVALAASFLIAYTVAPWAALRWCSVPKPAAEKEAIPGGRLGAWYTRWARPLIGHPRREMMFVGLILLCLTLAFLMPAWQLIRPAGPGGAAPALGIEMSFLPKDNKNTFNVTLELPRGTPSEVTDRAVRDVALLVAEIPEVTNYQTWTGLGGVPDFNSLIRGNAMAGSYIGAVRVNLTDKTERRRSSIVMAQELRTALKDMAVRYPGITVQVVEDPPGPPQKGTVYAEIYAEDGELLKTLSDATAEAFRTTYDMAEVTQSQDTEAGELRLRIDRDKAALSGVVPVVAARALAHWVQGEKAGYAHTPGERRDEVIRLRVKDGETLDPAFLRNVTVPGALGRRVPLSELVTATPAPLPRKIEKKDGVRMTAVGGELGSTASTYAVLDLDRRLDGEVLPGGGTLTTGNLGWEDARPDLTLSRAVLFWQGEMRMMLDSYRDLAISLCLSVGSIFLILVAYYQSFGLAAIALAAVPLCFIGMFPGHWLFGVQFSASSLVGVTALSGVVVRSSLLIIDFVIDYLKAGLPLTDAVIDAGAVRLRPILLTTLAIVLGSLILMPDPVFGGLAITFVFGAAASTVFTIFLIPILLNVYFRKFPYRAKA